MLLTIKHIFVLKRCKPVTLHPLKIQHARYFSLFLCHAQIPVLHPSVSPSPHLQYEQEKEVGVGYFLELLKQVDGQKGDDVVL